MMKALYDSKAKWGAFSLTELLAVMAGVAIVATVGFAVLTGMNKSIHEKKLKAEIVALNSAAASYMGFGGNLDDAESPEEVLAQLRSIAASDIADRIPGLSSSMVDPRIAAVVVTEDDAETGELRVVWNSAKKIFETATSGAGITAFFLNADDAEIEQTEDVREFLHLYSENSTWIWDHTEEAVSMTEGPTEVVTYNPITIINNSTPPTPIDPEVDPETQPSGLNAPVLSLSGGGYSIRDYDLGTTISNPNQAGSSDVYYQVNYANWEKYTPGNVILIEPGSHVVAQAIATSSDWIDSSRTEQSYEVTPVQLNAPTINPSSARFGVFTDRLITVTLENTNGDDPATMQYSVAGGPWTDYSELLLLDRVDFEGGVTIHSRAQSTDPYYSDSEEGVASLSVDLMTLAGAAEGNFHSPTGGSGMVTNLGYYNPEDSYFEWGRITDYYGNPYYGLTKSWLYFDGHEANDVALENRFLLGHLDYYNGKILSGTGANGVNLALDLSFSVSGSTNSDTEFDYDFELINTLNNNYNPYDWASADFVSINRYDSTTMFDIGDMTFELILEFGETTDAGFSNFDEFHVLEEHTATSNLYATLFDRTETQGSIGSDGVAYVVEPEPEPEEEDDDAGEATGGSDDATWW